MKNKSYPRKALAALMCAVALSTGAARAGTETSDTKSIAAPPPASTPAPNSAISGDFGLTVTNLYDSRGYALVTRGAMFQPNLDIYFNAYSSDNGFLTGITPTLSFWGDVNSDEAFTSSPTSTVKPWYEFDWMPGVTFTFVKRLALTVSYYEFDSPNGGFNTARSINSTLAYDDTGLFDKSKNFSFQPHVTVLDELSAPGSAGAYAGGTYVDVGIAPKYTVLGNTAYPITFQLPITYDFGDHFYTEGISFGYVSAGIQASVPLAFIPAQYGSWGGTIGFKYFHTGDSVNIPEFRDQETVNVGISCTF